MLNVRAYYGVDRRLLSNSTLGQSRLKCAATTVLVLGLLFAVQSLLSGVAEAQSTTARTISRPVFPSPQDSGAVCNLDLCRVIVIQDVEVPALENGALVGVFVKDGDFVQKGALLAQINDRQAQLQKRAAQKELDKAMTEASNDLAVRLARATFEVADAEYQQGLKLKSIREGAISATVIRQRRLARYEAELKIDKSSMDLNISKMSADINRAAVDLADDRIQRQRIISPIDGIVTSVYRSEDDQRVCQIGQWVQEGQPVLRVIRMDRLFVEGRVSAAEYSPSDIDGRPVTVQAQLARGRKEEFKGRIVFVNPTVDKRNNYRVRAEVKNRTEKSHWLLLPGTTAGMSVHLQ